MKEGFITGCPAFSKNLFEFKLKKGEIVLAYAELVEGSVVFYDFVDRKTIPSNDVLGYKILGNI